MEDSNEIKVFLLDDDEDDFIIVEDMLEELNNNSNISVEWEPDYNKALERLKKDNYDICLVDYRLGEHNGLEFIREVKTTFNEIPLILLTGQGDSEIDYEAMKLGAADYLVKGKFDASLLGRSIRYAINHARSTRELNANEQKYRSLFERSVDAIYLINKEHLFIDFNRSLEQLLGYDKHELLSNMSMKGVFKSKKEYSYFNEMLVKQQQVRDFEVKLCTKDEKELDCIINSVVLKNENDEIYAYQGIIHDLTVRKRAEQELLVAEKLSMTGQIARSMAHEVRNPLTNLNLAMEQLRDEIEEKEDVTLYLDIIKRNAGRIEQLITEMLKSSKPKDLNQEELNINEVLEETLTMTKDRLKLRGITLKADFDNNLPKLNVDKEQLKTAFLNIVINAIEAMEENQGTLKLNTYLKEELVVVQVADNGKGIPQEEIRKLFDPFFTGKQGGMGLGLTSTQNILNGHKAKVNVESEVGEGTTFTIVFDPTRAKA